MARIPDNQYYQGWDTGTNNANATGLGSNRFLTLEDVVNNYIVLYNDDENHGSKMRLKIEAFAQRAVQEFSYEIFRVKDLEYEVVDVARFPMPQDFVELVNINYVDQYGQEHWLIPRKDSSSPRSPLQGIQPEYESTRGYGSGEVVVIIENEGAVGQMFAYYRSLNMLAAGVAPTTGATDANWEFLGRSSRRASYIYDSDGNIIYASGTSVTKERWDMFDDQRRGSDINSPVGAYTTEGGYYTYGKRYYLDTETVNQNPTYWVNEAEGVIELDAALLTEVITVRYVSDGLSNDFSQIQVHKFCEQALYDTIYYEMIARRNDVPANEKERAKRRMVAKKKEAKLRLSPISPRELIQTFRTQARWIKT